MGAALSALQERRFPRDRRLSRDGLQDSPLAVAGQFGPSRAFRLRRAHVSFDSWRKSTSCSVGADQHYAEEGQAMCFCLANPV